MGVRALAVGNCIPGSIVAIQVTANDWYKATANADGYVLFPAVDDQLTDSAIFIKCSSYRDYLHHVRWHGVNDQPKWATLNHQVNLGEGELPLQVPESLPKLVSTPNGFQTVLGTPYTWAQVSLFRAEDKIRLGIDIDPVLEQVKRTKANGIRVLRDASWFSTRAGFSTDSLILLSRQANSHGLYVQYCIFADWMQVHGGDLGVAREVYNNVVNRVRADKLDNIILQLVNEGNQHGQDFPFGSFDLPNDILSSRGSNGTGDNPPPPYPTSSFYYNSLGTERRPERAALCTTTIYFAINGYFGESNFEGTKWMTVVDEPYGIGTPSESGKDRRTNLEECYLLGLGTRWDPYNRAGGGTAHTDQGIDCSPLDDLTFNCISEFIRGVFDWN